jgi:hypothetical protein
MASPEYTNYADRAITLWWNNLENGLNAILEDEIADSDTTIEQLLEICETEREKRRPL